MERNNDQISSAQLAAILSVTIIGIGILSLPRTVTEAAGPDGWMIVLGGSFLALVIGLAMAVVVRKFSKKSMLEFSSTLMGKPLGIIISIGFCIYLLIFSAIEVRSFGEIAKEYLLFRTPVEVLMITLLFCAVYLVRSGIEPIARMAQIIFPIATFTAIASVLPILPELDFTYFLPVFKTPILKLIKSLPIVFFSFAGIEITLLFSKFVTDPKNIKKSIFLTVGLVGTIYMAIVTITVARFGLRETTHIIWPALEIFKTVDLPGAFIENIQIYVISVWILSLFMTLSVFYYGTSLILSHLLGSKEQNYFVFPLMPIIYYLALMPENLGEIIEYADIFSNYAGAFYMIILPIFLLVLSGMKKDKGGKKSA